MDNSLHRRSLLHRRNHLRNTPPSIQRYYSRSGSTPLPHGPQPHSPPFLHLTIMYSPRLCRPRRARARYTSTGSGKEIQFDTLWIVVDVLLGAGRCCAVLWGDVGSDLEKDNKGYGEHKRGRKEEYGLWGGWGVQEGYPNGMLLSLVPLHQSTKLIMLSPAGNNSSMHLRH